MDPLNISPEKRVATILFHLESFLVEARDAASKGDKERLYGKLGAAFELIGPLMASLDILEESQRISLVEKLIGVQN